MSWRIVRSEEPAERAAPARRTAPAPRAQGGGARVLIVDDEASICKALSIALVQAGFEATAAQSGESAHALLEAHDFDVLLLDLRMPDLRGDVLYHIAIALRPQLVGHTIFLTGDITERAQALITACGCTAIQKPFNLDEIIGEVKKLAPRQSATA
jgi:DNA-binding response OmpR family regulator